MKRTITVWGLLMELISTSGLFVDGQIPGVRSPLVIPEDVWAVILKQSALPNFGEHLSLNSKDVIPGLSGDKFEEGFVDNPLLSEGELAHPPDWSVDKNGGKPHVEWRPHDDRNSTTTRPKQEIIDPRGNATSQTNAGSDVPDKNFIDWVLNPFTTTTTKATPVAPEDCPACQCGLSAPPNRIVGGAEAQMAKYPWVVYLTYNNKFYCAASIISDRYVLTAAHCVDRFNKNQMRVVVGAHNRSDTSETMTYRVADIIKHGSYSTANYNNDIALIKIDGRIVFKGPMRPVCLSDRGPTYAGWQGIVTGWGATVESGSTSNTLQEVAVPIMTNAACRATKYPARKITENMMCAGYPEGGQDSCQGDSGGPLHVLDGKTYKVVGIVSWGEGCAAPGYPGVYARVNRYITWIEFRTKDSCRCLSDN
ncbi:trypsin-1-like [Fopius arisanus]|uniref:Trypsin-1-like n=1 Tax=Fopius arisanus TaxID=64838 RepID=A0A9R1T3H7_9HYME|nr:PREDICTED: trypsin-1-like [Fopius arisanus]